jgi:hypothetical protein
MYSLSAVRKLKRQPRMIIQDSGTEQIEVLCTEKGRRDTFDLCAPASLRLCVKNGLRYSPCIACNCWRIAATRACSASGSPAKIRCASS